MDKGSPPPDIFSALSNNWTPGTVNDEAPDTTFLLLHAAADLAVGAWAETGQAPHELICTLAGHHAEGVDRLTFLVFNR